MKANDLIKLLLQKGWYEVRQNGSHKIFKHPTIEKNIAVPMHGKKDIAIGTLKEIQKTAGLK